MNSPDLRVGVIGLGWFGRVVLDELLAHPRVNVTEVCDPAAGIADEVADRVRAGSHLDHRDLLRSDNLDAVYIASPPGTHRDIVLDALQRDVHVLCEKPLGINASETEEIRRATDAAGVVVAVDFPLQHHQVGYAWSQRHSEGYLGQLRGIEIRVRCPTWPRPYQNVGWVATRRQGGPVLEICTHLVHLVRSVYGDLTVLESMVEWPEDPEVSETLVRARLQLTDGTPVDLRAVTGVGGEESVTVVADGTLGTLAMLEWGRLSEGRPGSPLSISELARSGSVLEGWIAAIEGDPGGIVDAHQAHQTQVVIDAVRAML